jgi:hypothetical protein
MKLPILGLLAVFLAAPLMGCGGNGTSETWPVGSNGKITYPNATVKVGKSGGSISTAGGFKIVFAANAFSSDTLVTVNDFVDPSVLVPSTFPSGKSIYAYEAVAIPGGKPAADTVVTFPLSMSLAPGMILGVYRFDSTAGDWVALGAATAAVDAGGATATGTVAASTPNFTGTIGLFA